LRSCSTSSSHLNFGLPFFLLPSGWEKVNFMQSETSSVLPICPSHFTYLRSWALLEKPPIVQPLKNFPEFIEPQGSSPCSQEPSTGSYTEPDRSNLYHSILSL
jgi:hypothetical protein